MTAEILFDLSRLLWSAGRRSPTGIDRVELVHAKHHLEVSSDRLHFAAATPWHRLGSLPHATSERFIAALSATWEHGHAQSAVQAVALARRLRRHLIARGGEAGLHKRLKSCRQPLIYLLVSHHHLDRPELIERLQSETNARFVALLHDTIPLHFPEYARPGQALRHTRRMETVARLADGIIHNSQSTMDMFAPFLCRAGRHIPQVVAHLGTELEAPPEAAAGQPALASFVYVGTIEPRKNHLLLLHLWRRLAAAEGATVPKLILVGRRGWENENILDMLERCDAIQPHIEEHNQLADREMLRLLTGARALLLPSFAEGYGLPLAEALALGVPALCSDLPALREIGGDVPEYLDPLDGPAWLKAIMDYAQPESGRRQAQIERLRHWSPPRWADHLQKVDGLLREVADMQPLLAPVPKAPPGPLRRLFPSRS